MWKLFELNSNFLKKQLKLPMKLFFSSFFKKIVHMCENEIPLDFLCIFIVCCVCAECNHFPVQMHECNEIRMLFDTSLCSPFQFHFHFNFQRKQRHHELTWHALNFSFIINSFNRKNQSSIAFEEFQLKCYRWTRSFKIVSNYSQCLTHCLRIQFRI